MGRVVGRGRSQPRQIPVGLAMLASLVHGCDGGAGEPVAATGDSGDDPASMMGEGGDGAGESAGSNAGGVGGDALDDDASQPAGDDDSPGDDDIPGDDDALSDDQSAADDDATTEDDDTIDSSDCSPRCDSGIACETEAECPDEQLNVACMAAACDLAPTCVYAQYEDAVPQPSLACSCEGEVVTHSGAWLAEPVAWEFSGLSACGGGSSELASERSTCLGLACEPTVPSEPLRAVLRGSDLPLADGTSLVLQSDRRYPSMSATVEGGAIEVDSGSWRHLIVDTDGNGGCSEDEGLLQFSTHLRPAESELVFRPEPDLEMPLCTTQVNLLESPHTAQCDELLDGLSESGELTTSPAPDAANLEPLLGYLAPTADLVDGCPFARFALDGSEAAIVARYTTEGLRLLFVHAGDPEECAVSGCRVAVYADTADGRYLDGYSKIFDDAALAIGGIMTRQAATWFILRRAAEDDDGNAVETNAAYLVETQLDGSPPEVSAPQPLESLFEE